MKNTFYLAGSLILIISSCVNTPQKPTYLDKNKFITIETIYVNSAIVEPITYEVTYFVTSNSAGDYQPLAGFLLGPLQIATGAAEILGRGEADNEIAARIKQYTTISASSIVDGFLYSTINGTRKNVRYAYKPNMSNEEIKKYDAQIFLTVKKISLYRISSIMDKMALSVVVNGKMIDNYSMEKLWDRDEIVSLGSVLELKHITENGISNELNSLIKIAGEKLGYDFAY